ncbi:DsrE/DsrF/DrsH-like family protein [Thermospira aquatica]|uniref:DsrE/DsrF/DrsH-like family protein n=1 Tax=Thermospira aquatica TaxID=2828656 RepID=A0AAX3BAH7_9SPIR|nr:DsrE/DsrF/DrsH-like family protein [Thermospira aquatica]URA09235.1 DsrE/DsrF/DrsH-like family protein [Thermospira aquatica]
MENQKKISIVCFSGDFDKAIAIFTIASGAAAVGYEVNLFFTFWGFNIIKKKKVRSPIGKGILAKMFNFLMGGRKNLPLSRLNFGGVSPKLMTYLMKNRNVATLEELINASIELGVNFYACEMSMIILGIKLADFIPQIKEVLGVAKFLEIAKGGEILFIS